MSTRTTHRHHPSHAHTEGVGDGPTRKAPLASAEMNPEDRFRLIQVRAYALWEQAGRPNDDDSRERFWFDAEKEIEASGSGIA